MNRFLKREWDTVRLPADALVRARNRAWQRLHGETAAPARRFPLWWGAAAAAALLVIVIVTTRPPFDPVRLPAGTIEALPVGDRQLAITVPRVEPPPAQPAPRVAPLPAAPVPDVPERIVVQMRLPESGTRMIWIKDSRFDISGGLQ